MIQLFFCNNNQKNANANLDEAYVCLQQDSAVSVNNYVDDVGILGSSSKAKFCQIMITSTTFLKDSHSFVTLRSWVAQWKSACLEIEGLRI